MVYWLYYKKPDDIAWYVSDVVRKPDEVTKQTAADLISRGYTLRIDMVDSIASDYDPEDITGSIITDKPEEAEQLFAQIINGTIN